MRDRNEGVLWRIRWTHMSQIESPMGFLLALSQVLPYVELLCRYSNLNIFSKIYKSEVFFSVFTSCSFLKFKVAVSELRSILCVMWEDCKRSLRKLLTASQNHQLKSLDLHSEVTEHTARRKIMELKGLKHKQAEFISAVKETEKSQEAGIWNKTSLPYVLIWLQRIKGWSLC